MLCEYGCGKPGIFTLKNGKKCCSLNYQQCIAIKLKNSNGNKGKAKKARAIAGQISNRKKTYCKYCSKQYSITGIQSHEEYCYMNPKNRKNCPICNSPIKNYRSNKTCSYKCGSLLDKNLDCTGKGPVTKSINYRLICFTAHGEKCLFCNEDLMVDAHHLDGDRCNNDPENLIPVCTTHHKYCHHTDYYYIVKECIDEYIEKFKKGEL